MSSQKQKQEALTQGVEGEGWHFQGLGQEHVGEKWSQSHWSVLLVAMPGYKYVLLGLFAANGESLFQM